MASKTQKRKRSASAIRDAAIRKLICDHRRTKKENADLIAMVAEKDREAKNAQDKIRVLQLSAKELREENVRLTADNKEVWSERQKHTLLQKTLENLRPSVDSPQLKYARDSLKHTQLELAALVQKVREHINKKITIEELKAAAEDTASTAGQFNTEYDRAIRHAKTTTALMEDFSKMLPAPETEENDTSEKNKHGK